jgi:hypothetical protein
VRDIVAAVVFLVIGTGFALQCTFVALLAARELIVAVVGVVVVGIGNRLAVCLKIA